MAGALQSRDREEAGALTFSRRRREEEIEMSDPFDLQRFLNAQNPVFESVLTELRQGRKQEHWMWFIFPQITGLGHSGMARKFSISSQAEAAAYLAHPILGPRLTECTRLVNLVEGRSIQEILGDIDSMKFRSSMTLFARAAGNNRSFIEALEKYFAGQEDPLTLDRL